MLILALFRKIIIGLIFIFPCMSLYSCQTEEKSTVVIPHNDTIYTYANPLSGITNIGDPYILKAGTRYYLYATSSGVGFKVWTSDNMVDWTEYGLALNRDYPGNYWGKGNFWAPEVKYIQGTYFMTYSALQDNGTMKIRIASSSSPLGPFVNYSEPFLNNDNFSYIDGSLLEDQGQVYLYYVKDCSLNILNGKHISQIYMTRLSNDLKSFASDPVLAISPSQNWEGIGSDWQWNEGPAVIKHENTYYLLYSANVYNCADYSVGVATAASPEGPWTKYFSNPVLKKNEALMVSGPGHCNFTYSPDSTELFLVYHTHTNYSAPSGDRNVCIDRMIFNNGVLQVQGPTRTAQPLPSGCAPRIIRKYE